MSGFTKLFSSITDSTIWQESDHTRLVWITMLAMSDQNGYVAASVPGLASRARVPLESCIQALESFQTADKWSRTPEFDGKRIAVTGGGWLLLNHAKYREIQSAETRKEQARKGMAALRAQRKKADEDVSIKLASVSKVNIGEHQLSQAEAEADTDTEADTEADKTKQSQNQAKSKPTVEALPLHDFVNTQIWEMYKKHRGSRFSTNAQSLILKTLAKAKLNGHDPNAMLEQSIANGWKGVFEPKSQGANYGNERSQRRRQTIEGLTGYKAGSPNATGNSIKGFADRVD